MSNPEPAAALPPSLDHSSRLHIQDVCKERLHQLTYPFWVESPEDTWEKNPTPTDPEHGRWRPKRTYGQLLPSLLEQVRLAVAGERPAPAASSGRLESKPTAALEAMDVETYIEVESIKYTAQVFHIKSPGAEAALRLIEERLPTLTDDQLRDLQRLVRGWWVSARIMSGLAEKPMRPHMPCPLCNKQDSIRTRLDESGSELMAWCVKCRESWDDSTIGLLFASIDDPPGERPRSTPAPRFTWIFLGNASQAKRWALAQGFDPAVVYPAADGPDALAGLRGPVNLVIPPDRGSKYADTLGKMAEVVHLVRDANARVEFDS